MNLSGIKRHLPVSCLLNQSSGRPSNPSQTLGLQRYDSGFYRLEAISARRYDTGGGEQTHYNRPFLAGRNLIRMGFLFFLISHLNPQKIVSFLKGQEDSSLWNLVDNIAKRFPRHRLVPKPLVNPGRDNLNETKAVRFRSWLSSFPINLKTDKSSLPTPENMGCLTLCSC